MHCGRRLPAYRNPSSCTAAPPSRFAWGTEPPWTSASSPPKRSNFDALFTIPFVRDGEVLQQEPATLSVSTPRTDTTVPVKVSFFGELDMGRVGRPQQTEDGVVWVASVLDLFATKLKVLLQRIAARDYEDIAAILRSGISLEDGLGAAVALYGPQFPPMEAVKTLAWFETDDARNVEAATRDYLSRTAADWHCDVSAITRTEDRRVGP